MAHPSSFRKQQMMGLMRPGGTVLPVSHTIGHVSHACHWHLRFLSPIGSQALIPSHLIKRLDQRANTRQPRVNITDCRTKNGSRHRGPKSQPALRIFLAHSTRSGFFCFRAWAKRPALAKSERSQAWEPRTNTVAGSLLPKFLGTNRHHPPSPAPPGVSN